LSCEIAKSHRTYLSCSSVSCCCIKEEFDSCMVKITCFVSIENRF
jgi:hypothetical protein